MSRLSQWRAGAVNRNYHVVRHLVNRPEVENIVMVDTIPHSPLASMKQAVKGIVSTGSSGGQKTTREVFNGKYIWHISSSSFPLIKRQIDHLQQGEGPLFMWSFNPFFTPLFDAFPNAIKIFDAVDNWTEHQTYRYQKARLGRIYQEIDKNADLIFSVSKNAKKLFPTNRNVHWIPNGVDKEHFQPCAPHPKLADLPKPIIGYHGVIEHRVDFDLVADVARSMPDVTFAFVGPVWKTANTVPVKALPNVHLAGPIPYQEIPAAVATFDAGWVPHRVNAFTKSMNPLKLLEYAAMEKPIVSTPVAGASDYKPYIRLAETAEETKEQLTQALTTKSIPALRDFAKTRTWDRVANRMYDLLAEKWTNKTQAPHRPAETWAWPK